VDATILLPVATADSTIEDDSVQKTADLVGKLFQVPTDEADEFHREHDQP
jgi:hypothetical protein